MQEKTTVTDAQLRYLYRNRHTLGIDACFTRKGALTFIDYKKLCTYTNNENTEPN